MAINIAGTRAHALLTPAQNGTPSRLTELSLYMSSEWSSFIRILARVFEADGLPSLRELGLTVNDEGNEDQGTRDLFDRWTEPWGVNVKLKRLKLDVPMLEYLETRLIEMLKHPAFCPRLRTFEGPSPMKSGSIKRALKTRWRTIQAGAQAAGGGH